MNWMKRAWPIFLQVATVFSFIINIMLVVALLWLAPILSKVRIDTRDPRGPTLYLTVRFQGDVDVDFDLPVEQDTVVVLNEDVPLTARTALALPGEGGVINATVSLNLPRGLRLPVHVGMDVPVENALPVSLEAPITLTLSSHE